jgi:hypothetical protein
MLDYLVPHPARPPRVACWPRRGSWRHEVDAVVRELRAKCRRVPAGPMTVRTSVPRMVGRNTANSSPSISACQTNNETNQPNHTNNTTPTSDVDDDG